MGERHLGQPGDLVGNRLQASLIDTSSSIASIQAPVARGHAGVGEAGRMRKEIPDRDRPVGGHGGDVFARVILGKAQDPHVLQLGQVLFHRVVQAELALLDEHHHRDTGDRLGHRGDGEDRILGHGRLAGHVAVAERGLVGYLAMPRNHDNPAGDLPLIDKLLQGRLQFGELAGG